MYLFFILQLQKTYFKTVASIFIMKKWMTFFLVGAALLFGAVYLFIPNIVKLKASEGIGATRQGLYRSLLDKQNVAKWWPGKVSNDSFYFNNFVYIFNNNNITVLPVSVAGEGLHLSSSLFLIAVVNDSTQMEWVSAMATSYNPLKRIQAYFRANKIEADMLSILKKMKPFYSATENIYGFDIRKDLVADSILIQTSDSCKGIPSNQFIYSLIDKLRGYANAQSAKVTGYPMLNIFSTDSINFIVKVALPVDRELPTSGNIFQKRM